MKKSFIIVVCILLITALSFGAFYIHRRNLSKKDDLSKMTVSSLSIMPKAFVYLEDIGLGNFTSTGFAFDSKDNSYWIADHGTNRLDNLILYELDIELTHVINQIEIGDLTVGSANLQGICYDSSNDSLWLALGDSICEVNKDGSIIQAITIPMFRNYRSNGICMDDDGETLWVLCYSQFLLHIDKTGKVIDKVRCNYQDQDMIFMRNGIIYITVGADYQGENNYILSYNPTAKSYSIPYRVCESYAVEGLYITDDAIYIVNDGEFHNAKIPRTYISVYSTDSE